MFCWKCGTKLEDDERFCSQCGEQVIPVDQPDIPVAEAPVVQPPVVETPVVEMPVAQPAVPQAEIPEKKKKPKKAKKEKKVREKADATPKKSRKKLWVTLIILFLLVGSIVTLAVLAFPLEVKLDKSGKTKTTSGTIRELEITVTANQPIISVKYALNPASHKDLTLYTEGECEGGLLEKTLLLEKIKIPAGKSVLYIHVKTLFGSYTESFSLTYDFGYTAEPMSSAIVTIDEGIAVLDNELLVFFQEDVSSSDAKALIEAYGGEIVGQIYALNQYQVRFAYSDLYSLHEKKISLEAESTVAIVSYNMLMDNSVSAYPNDRNFDDWDTDFPAGNNWGLECIDAPGAWDYMDQMVVTKVGVIDSSLDYSHEDLQIDSSRYMVLPTDDFPTLESLMDYYEEATKTHVCPPRCNFCSMRDHGTHCTGIIGARGDNKKGICGVSWNTDLYFTTWWYNCYDDYGNFKYYSTYNGWMYDIAYLVASGCRVISISIGSSAASDPGEWETDAINAYDSMIQKLEDAGYDFLIVKAAGNSNDNASDYHLNRVMTTGEHARAHTVIVGAIAHSTNFWKTEVRYSVASYSNYGEIVDIMAPGSNIYSTVMNGYGNMSGTSMATPMVAGVASLLYSTNPNLTYDEVKDILCSQTNLTCAKGGFAYPIVNARLAVEYVREEGGGNPQRPEPVVGFVTGTIQDAATQELLTEASVLVTDTATGKSFAAGVVDGVYYLYADPGVYDMTFHADGYLDETIYGVEITAGVTSYNIRLNMATETAENGWASGRIVDAFDASSISYATLQVFKGVNNKDGECVATATSDYYGYYELELAPGNYTICASADGYTTSYTTILIVGGSYHSDQNCVLTPVLDEGEIRVVLTWGAYPSDLDSHMVGPTPNGGQFHTWYYGKNYYYGYTLYVNLDVDDTSSYGPETTSVYVGVNGTYTFYVHDYTNRGYAYTSEMATSNAQVKVYIGGSGEYYEFNVPNDDGNIWTVFSITNGVLTPINTMTYGDVEDIP